MENKVKIAFVGVGGIFDAHISFVVKNPAIEVYALCDIDENKLRVKGEKYGVTRLFTDYKEMLKLDEIDGVVVCTWNKEHAPISIAAMKAGKHVFCEKPMAMNTREAEEMLEEIPINCSNKFIFISLEQYGSNFYSFNYSFSISRGNQWK